MIGESFAATRAKKLTLFISFFEDIDGVLGGFFQLFQSNLLLFFSIAKVMMSLAKKMIFAKLFSLRLFLGKLWLIEKCHFRTNNLRDFMSH